MSWKKIIIRIWRAGALNREKTQIFNEEEDRGGEGRGRLMCKEKKKLSRRTNRRWENFKTPSANKIKGGKATNKLGFIK